MRPSEDGPDPALLDAAFAHGYLIYPGTTSPDTPTARTDGPPPPISTCPEVTGWPVRDIAGYRYHLHPRTVATVATGGPGTLVLLGHPLDVDAGLATAGRIADRLLATWAGAGADAVVRDTAYLGGRWTALLHAADPDATLRVVPDCAASHPVYWSATPAGPVLGSAGALVAHTLGLEPDPVTAQAYRDIATFRPPHRTVAYPPGLHTEHEGVRLLPPNQLLTHSRGRTRFDRFWPAEDRQERTDPAQVFREFRTRLTAHVGLVTGLGRPGISLTAGHDSRTTLAALLPHRTPDTFGFTYYNPRQGVADLQHRADLFEGGRWARLAGIPHLALAWRKPPEDGVVDRACRRTYPVFLGSLGAAQAMYADLPRDLVQLASNLGEVGTASPRSRKEGPPDPRRLADLWQSRRLAEDHDYDGVFAEYREAVRLVPEALAGYDWHDLFYWEHRMGKWGIRKYLDGDLGHRLMLPFNDRRLLEVMLSLPVQLREDKTLFTMMQAAAPELAGGLPPARGPLQPPPAPEDPLSLGDLLAARPRWRQDVRPRLRRLRGTP